MYTYPFAIDSHLCLVVDAQILNLVYLPHAFHVSRVTASAKNHGDTCSRIDVRRSDERSGGVIDERR